LFVVFSGKKQPQHVGKNARNLKKIDAEVITTFFKKNSAKCTNFQVSSLGLELPVWSLGVFDEVSVTKVTVSTTSLLIYETQPGISSGLYSVFHKPLIKYALTNVQYSFD